MASEFNLTRRILDPRHYFFLKRVKEVVDELNSRTLGNRTSARKSLIMYGLIPPKDRVWSLEQLIFELRNIAQSNMAYLHGQSPRI